MPLTQHGGIGVFVLVAAGVVAACNATNADPTSYPDPTSIAGTIAPTPGPQPTFTEALNLDASPPPISGGTLALAPDGRTVIAADPDRDRVYVIDIPTRTVKLDIPVTAGAEPGRVTVDAHNFAHVALRSSGGIASIDLATGKETERPVCVSPRGIAYDAKIDSLHVACSEGLLVTIPLAGGDPKHIGLDEDLRDVIVSGDTLFVSHFRSATVNVITREGAVVRSSTQGGNLGWRMAAAVNDPNNVAVVSQNPQNPAPTPGSVGYYGSGALDACNAPTITSARLDIPGEDTISIPPAVLPVDLATNGTEYAIVAAGNGHTPELPQIFVHQVATKSTSDLYPGVSSSGAYGTNPACTAMAKGFIPGQAIAAIYDGDDNLLVQSREPAKLFIMSPDRQRVAKEIPLSTVSREDSGHALFHSNSGGFLACASCHAEGGEDGRTWTFTEGERRTPSMRGTIANTAPYHWDGAMKDVRDLVDHVFVTRMSGPKVDDAHVSALSTWLNKVPPPPKVTVPADAVARGQTLFHQRGCDGCHAGDHYTNNLTTDVGTGAAFQVPPLVGVRWRAPFLHNGCAATLKDRFAGTACAGAKHGDVSGLADADVNDLVSFLESL